MKERDFDMRNTDLLKNKNFSVLEDSSLVTIEGGKNQLAYEIGYAAGKITRLVIEVAKLRKK